MDTKCRLFHVEIELEFLHLGQPSRLSLIDEYGCKMVLGENSLVGEGDMHANLRLRILDITIARYTAALIIPLRHKPCSSFLPTKIPGANSAPSPEAASVRCTCDGHPYYDTVAVKVVNASSIEITTKKDGKTMFTDTRTVSPDGNTLNEKFTDTSEAKPVTGVIIFTRVSPGAAGSHAIAGAWRTSKVDTVSSNGLTVTYQGTNDGLKMSDPNGESYDAKFDGKDYPVEGDPGHTMVSLKRIGADTIEETDKRDGKVVGVSHMTVSKDGKSIQVEYNDKQHGTTTSFTMEKQS